MKKQKCQLIVALDVDTLEEARRIVNILDDSVNIYKVGGLFTIVGPDIIRFLKEAGKGVFLDQKLYDIPKTVSYSTSGAIVMSSKFQQAGVPHVSGLYMFTVHIMGGKSMLQEAVKANKETAKKCHIQPPLVIGVTVLTSDTNEENLTQTVLERARLAKDAGLDGAVASVHEAKLIRNEFGNDFVIVTPGIRPLGGAAEDQKRIATPKQAVENGSNYLVVGRPIIAAKDPLSSAKKILEEMKG